MDFGDYWLLIGDYFDFKDRQTLRGLNQLIRRKIKIYKIGSEYEKGLTDNILMMYPHLIELNANSNNKITDSSVSSLTNLIVLNVSYCLRITDTSVMELTNLKDFAIKNLSTMTIFITYLKDNLRFI